MLSLGYNPVDLSVAWGVVIASALVGAWFDVRERRIPNLLTGPLLVAGIVCAGMSGGLNGLANGALGCVLMAAPFLVLWFLAGGGAANAKLMGALGAWLGPTAGAVALACVLVCGAVIGMGWALWSGRLGEVSGNLLIMVTFGLASLAGRRSVSGVGRMLPNPHGMLKMPYGVAICAGVCIAVLGVHIWHF